jgi:3-hydroxyacyl-[acyl-carrier-protein] dehydratase
MTNEDILAFIPQRPPFVMIDSIVSADEKESITSFTIREGHLFVENGYFTEPGLIENMAQTAAAGTGFYAQQQGKPAPVGYIGALKGLNVTRLPFVDETITTTVTFVHQVMNAHIVQGKVSVGEFEMATCELKIFLQEDNQTA